MLEHGIIQPVEESRAPPQPQRLKTARTIKDNSKQWERPPRSTIKESHHGQVITLLTQTIAGGKVETRGVNNKER